MGRGFRRRSPALAIACLALFAALGGSVYAATKIDGRSIRVKSLPGNRLAPGSLPGNRLKAGDGAERGAGAGLDRRRPDRRRHASARCPAPLMPRAPRAPAAPRPR